MPGEKIKPGENIPLNILVIEDNPGDLILLEELLHALPTWRSGRSSIPIFWEARSHCSPRRRSISSSSICSLPDSSGIDGYIGLSQATQHLPVILLTGLTDTNTALQSAADGRPGLSHQGEFDERLLSRAIRYSMERKRNLETLRESEERYRDLFNNNPMPMWVFDPKTLRFLEVNEAAIQHYGYTYEEFLSKTIMAIYPPPEDAVLLAAELYNGSISEG